MSFDECIPYPASYEYAKASTERTIRWAKRGKAVHSNDNQSLFGIVQGGEYEDLREYSAKETVKLDFDGYSIGGTSVGEDKDTMYKMIDYAIKHLPLDKPRYLMGVGEPIDLLEGVERGIDMFDCVLPTRNARHGSFFTREGRKIIKNKEFERDSSPLDSHCNCYACQNHTKAYIRHLFRSGEATAAILMSIHNIQFLIDLVKDARKAILEDRYQEFYSERMGALFKNMV